jgi:DNA-binding CsgD family transcriptional regulator
MKDIYWNSTNDMLLMEDIRTHEVVRMDHAPRSFIVAMDRKIKTQYPEQYEELEKLIGREGCEYGRVYQFFACNFSIKHGSSNIDDDGNFIFERVVCPIRHNCKKGICLPPITGKLSERELQVIALFAKGFHEDEIGERLFISKSTVHNHITNIYQKLNLTGRNPDRQLIVYAFRNNYCC